MVKPPTPPAGKKLTPFGERLEAARGTRTQGEICAAMGVQPHNWWRWTTGETQPRGKNLVRLAGVLGVSVESLTGGDAGPGQEAPLNAAWREFVRLEFELRYPPPPENFKRTLATMRFYGVVPTVQLYRAMLLALEAHGLSGTGT